MAKKSKINESTQYYHGNKFLIYPTKEQKEFIDECIDVARYVYNWAIEQQEKQYKLYLDGKIEKKYMLLSMYDLCKIFTEYRNLPENSWLLKFPVGFCREAINNAVLSYLNFLDGWAKHPKFKSKKFSKSVYHPRADRMHIRDGNKLQIEGIMSFIKIDDRITKSNFSESHFTCQTISRDNLGNYYVSFNVIKNKPLSYFEDNNIPKMDRAIGIDLNFRKDARVVCSDGTRFIAPNISKEEKKIKRLSRKHTIDINRHKKLERANPDKIIEPSKRSIKRLNQLRKYYKRISNKNNTFACTVAKRIVEKNPLAIVMEDLQIEKLKQYNFIAKYCQFNPLGILKEKIEKKCNMYNIPFILADKNYPSSHICSNCGHIKNIYNYHTYICPECGMRMDRDDNAALNLEHLAYNYDFTHMSNINLANIS